MKCLKEITFPIKSELELFENELKNIIQKEDNFLKDDLIDFLFNNPKRLRPILVFLFAKILKIEDDAVLKIALIVELVHSASLIHDDILDDEKIRRKKLSFNFKYNSKIAVLEGDFLLASALKILSKLKAEILEIFSSRIIKTIQGELSQTENKQKLPSYDEYLKNNFNKTGSLFFACLESLYVLKNIDETTKINLNDYLYNFCCAFQIQNDINDFCDNKFSDIKNGNYTLPVIYFCMSNLFEDFNIKKDEFELCILKSKQKVEEYKQNAIASLQNLDDDTKYLKELIEYI